MMKNLRFLIAIVALFSFIVPNSVYADSKPLVELIKEAQHDRSQLSKQRKALRTAWDKNQKYIADMTEFRRKAQTNTERGVITVGARLLKDSIMKPLIKNHGYAVLDALMNVKITTNRDISKTTVSWANLRTRAAALIEKKQKEQKSLLLKIKSIDKKIAALNAKVAKWKAEYDIATGVSTASDTGSASYDDGAALAAWKADFEAKISSGLNYTEPTYTVTGVFSWVVSPYLKDSQVYGAYKVTSTKTFASGESVTWVSTEIYDASNPGTFVTVGELMRLYPKFSR